ncbi:unnamed protein product, partial [Ectocarpus sp. 12 AP-2014]
RHRSRDRQTPSTTTTTMAPALHQLFFFLLSGALLPHDAWSFSTSISRGRANPPAFSVRSHGRAAMMMMAKEGGLVRVSLPKPLGIQLEEVVPGSP